MKAFQEGLLLFNSSAIYINAMAAHHQNTSAVSTVRVSIPLPTCGHHHADLPRQISLHPLWSSSTVHTDNHLCQGN